MIGVLIVAHAPLADSLVGAVSHVLGTRPPQFAALPVAPDDDPLLLLPKAREAIAALDTGEGVVILADLYGATPCNLAMKLMKPGHVELIAGVSLPMLVRTFTYRTRGLETLVTKAVSGGCEGVIHV
jgi:mannose PTS system EIIA component